MLQSNTINIGTKEFTFKTLVSGANNALVQLMCAGAETDTLKRRGSSRGSSGKWGARTVFAIFCQF